MQLNIEMSPTAIFFIRSIGLPVKLLQICNDFGRWAHFNVKLHFFIIKYVVYLSDLYHRGHVEACSTIACQSIFCVINFFTRHSFNYREPKTTGSNFLLDHEPIIGGERGVHC